MVISNANGTLPSRDREPSKRNCALATKTSEGLCLALSDWSAELRILKAEQRREKPPGLNPAAGGTGLGSAQPLIE